MDTGDSAGRAFKAITAVFLKRTIGRALLAASLVFWLVSLLFVLNALSGFRLSWPLASLTAGFAITITVFTFAVYLIVARNLPRRLSFKQRSFINRFTKLLTERLELSRTAMPKLIWNLFLQSLMQEQHTPEQDTLQSAILHTPRLNEDFYEIKRWF